MIKAAAAKRNFKDCYLLAKVHEFGGDKKLRVKARRVLSYMRRNYPEDLEELEKGGE